MEMMRRWWRLPDHFDWLTGYLVTRGMMGAARTLLAAMVGSLALVPILLALSNIGPRSTLGVALSVLAGVAGWATMLPYLRRWPSRTQSVIVSLVATGAVAAVCLAQSDPLISLIACTGFVTPAAYVAFMHTARYTTTVFAVAVLMAAIAGVRLAAEGQLVGAIALFWFAVVLNAVVPFGVQTIVHALGVDVVRSEWDPLTGLLTRRAFYQRLSVLVTESVPADRDLLVAVIDLDRFKNLNDTQGHAAGDRALIAVGRALSRSADDDALVGRTGGEEFVVATISPSANPTQLAMRLRAGIEKAAAPLTASVGTASVPLLRLHLTGVRVGIDEAITAADTAMYAAKRAGGNQARHSQLTVDDDTA